MEFLQSPSVFFRLFLSTPVSYHSPKTCLDQHEKLGPSVRVNYVCLVQGVFPAFTLCVHERAPTDPWGTVRVQSR